MYLNGTKDRGLTLRIGETVASFGSHVVDGRSHTGAVLGIREALALLSR